VTRLAARAGRFLPSRADLPRDLLAGLTLGTAQIGVTMAYTILAGVPPVHGLYATMIGTPLGALTLSTQRMAMVTTAALCLTAGSALTGLPADQRIDGLITLTLLCGLVMLVAGLLRAGALVRFISRAVMAGFMAGVVLQIVLAQLPPLTGYVSERDNRVLQAVDLLAHLGAVDPATLLVGIGTIATVLLLSLTRLRLLAMAAVLVVGTAVVALLGLSTVATVGDIAPIPSGFPLPRLPDMGLAPQLLAPALALAIVGLVQAAGISASVSNADGSSGETSRDFVAHGLANVVGGSFGGAPVGGSVAATAVNTAAGARSRWSSVFAGIVVMVVVLVAVPLVAAVPQAVIAGIVVVAAVGQVKPAVMRDIWAADRLSAGVMALTFALVLVLPIHWAVLIGAGISLVKYVYQSSLDVRVVCLTVGSGGRCRESQAPSRLADDTVLALDIYGSLFFAAGPKLKRSLPAVDGARRAVVVLRLRGRGRLHSAVLALLRDYAAELVSGGGRLYLAGVGAEMREQMRRTGLLAMLGEDAVLPATDEPYRACELAVVHGREWLAAGERERGRRESGAENGGGDAEGGARTARDERSPQEGRPDHGPGAAQSDGPGRPA
jgi:SulP family sulfate permease